MAGAQRKARALLSRSLLRKLPLPNSPSAGPGRGNICSPGSDPRLQRLAQQTAPVPSRSRSRPAGQGQLNRARLKASVYRQLSATGTHQLREPRKDAVIVPMQLQRVWGKEMQQNSNKERKLDTLGTSSKIYFYHFK